MNKTEFYKLYANTPIDERRKRCINYRESWTLSTFFNFIKGNDDLCVPDQSPFNVKRLEEDTDQMLARIESSKLIQIVDGAFKVKDRRGCWGCAICDVSDCAPGTCGCHLSPRTGLGKIMIDGVMGIETVTVQKTGNVGISKFCNCGPRHEENCPSGIGLIRALVESRQQNFIPTQVLGKGITKADLSKLIDDVARVVHIPTPEDWKCPRKGCNMSVLHQHTTYPTLRANERSERSERKSQWMARATAQLDTPEIRKEAEDMFEKEYVNEAPTDGCICHKHGRVMMHAGECADCRSRKGVE